MVRRRVGKVTNLMYHRPMTTFGDPAAARFLYDNQSRRNIKDFHIIGSGCYRTAYLHTPSNLIYKVGDYDANVHEAHASRRLTRRSIRNLSFKVHIPRTRTFRMPSGSSMYRECVVVQEYAVGAERTECASYASWMEPKPECDCKSTPCYTDVHHELEAWSGLDDIHSDNVLIDKNKVFWLIDMGC